MRKPWRQLVKNTVSALRLNFYRLHLSYFILVILITSVILYGGNTSGYHVSYTDALFLCASAMCNVGLNTLNLGTLNGFQQSVLFILMPLGDLTIVTISVVVIRRYYFRKKIKDFLQHSEVGRDIAEDIERNADRRRANPRHSDQRTEASGFTSDLERPDHLDSVRQRVISDSAETVKSNNHLLPDGYGGFPAPWEFRYLLSLLQLPFRYIRLDDVPDHNYLSFDPTLDDKVRPLSRVSAIMY